MLVSLWADGSVVEWFPEGLELLAAHAVQFGQHLLTDFKLMYTFMLEWATSKNRGE